MNRTVRPNPSAANIGTADLDASEALHNSTTAALLRAAYALTHQMHVLDTRLNPQRAADLRAQRDLIDAEIERRCRS